MTRWFIRTLVSMLGLRTVARTTPLYGCHGPRSSSSNRAAQAAQHVTLTSTSVDPLHLCHPQASYLSTSTSASTTRPRLSSVQQIRCENSNNMRKRRFRIPYYEINRNKTKRLQDTPKKLMATMTGLRSGNLESLEKIVRPTKILTSGKFDKYSETRRSFWTWRGGDDKRWDFSSSMSETAVSTSTDRGEQQANSEELEPASPAATSTVSASEDFTLDKSLKIPASATIDNEDDRLSADGEKANQSSATAASSTTTQQCPPTPITTYEVSACTAQGYRTYMEDEFFLSLDGDFAAVFDGHGGRAVSRYLRQNLYANLQAMLPVVVTPATTSPIPSPSRDVHNDSATLSVDGSNSPHSDDNTESDVATSKRSSPTVKDYENAVSAALAKVDREVQRISHWSYQGSTAVVIWIHEDRNGNSPPARLKQADGGLVGMPGSLSPASTSKPDQHSTTEEEPSITDTTTPSNVRTIIAANIGDSRAVLCRDGVAWDLTRDHKPNDPHEQERIERLGGKVVWCGEVDRYGEPILEQGIYRVNGNLALSRAIGDRSERPMVTAEPEIISVPVQEDVDEFILVASDGLWDVMDSQEAVDYVRSLHEHYLDGLDRDMIATSVVEEALRRGTYDNITVLIIWLRR